MVARAPASNGWRIVLLTVLTVVIFALLAVPSAQAGHDPTKVMTTPPAAVGSPAPPVYFKDSAPPTVPSGSTNYALIGDELEIHITFTPAQDLNGDPICDPANNFEPKYSVELDLTSIGGGANVKYPASPTPSFDDYLPQSGGKAIIQVQADAGGTDGGAVTVSVGKVTEHCFDSNPNQVHSENNVPAGGGSPPQVTSASFGIDNVHTDLTLDVSPPNSGSHFGIGEQIELTWPGDPTDTKTGLTDYWFEAFLGGSWTEITRTDLDATFDYVGTLPPSQKALRFPSKTTLEVVESSDLVGDTINYQIRYNIKDANGNTKTDVIQITYDNLRPDSSEAANPAQGIDGSGDYQVTLDLTEPGSDYAHTLIYVATGTDPFSSATEVGPGTQFTGTSITLSESAIQSAVGSPPAGTQLRFWAVSVDPAGNKGAEQSVPAGIIWDPEAPIIQTQFEEILGELTSGPAVTLTDSASMDPTAPDEGIIGVYFWKDYDDGGTAKQKVWLGTAESKPGGKTLLRFADSHFKLYDNGTGAGQWNGIGIPDCDTDATTCNLGAIPPGSADDILQYTLDVFNDVIWADDTAGTWKLRVVAKDAVGNQQIATFPVNVDPFDAPTVTISSPIDSSTPTRVYRKDLQTLSGTITTANVDLGGTYNPPLAEAACQGSALCVFIKNLDTEKYWDAAGGWDADPVAIPVTTFTGTGGSREWTLTLNPTIDETIADSDGALEITAQGWSKSQAFNDVTPVDQDESPLLHLDVTDPDVTSILIESASYEQNRQGIVVDVGIADLAGGVSSGLASITFELVEGDGSAVSFPQGTVTWTCAFNGAPAPSDPLCDAKDDAGDGNLAEYGDIPDDLTGPIRFVVPLTGPLSKAGIGPNDPYSLTIAARPVDRMGNMPGFETSTDTFTFKPRLIVNPNADADVFVWGINEENAGLPLVHNTQVPSVDGSGLHIPPIYAAWTNSTHLGSSCPSQFNYACAPNRVVVIATNNLETNIDDWEEIRTLLPVTVNPLEIVNTTLGAGAFYHKFEEPNPFDLPSGLSATNLWVNFRVEVDEGQRTTTTLLPEPIHVLSSYGPQPVEGYVFWPNATCPPGPLADCMAAPRESMDLHHNWTTDTWYVNQSSAHTGLVRINVSYTVSGLDPEMDDPPLLFWSVEKLDCTSDCIFSTGGLGAQTEQVGIATCDETGGTDEECTSRVQPYNFNFTLEAPSAISADGSLPAGDYRFIGLACHGAVTSCPVDLADGLPIVRYFTVAEDVKPKTDLVPPGEGSTSLFGEEGSGANAFYWVNRTVPLSFNVTTGEANVTADPVFRLKRTSLSGGQELILEPNLGVNDPKSAGFNVTLVDSNVSVHQTLQFYNYTIDLPTDAKHGQAFWLIVDAPLDIGNYVADQGWGTANGEFRLRLDEEKPAIDLTTQGSSPPSGYAGVGSCTGAPDYWWQFDEEPHVPYFLGSVSDQGSSFGGKGELVKLRLVNLTSGKTYAGDGAWGTTEKWFNASEISSTGKWCYKGGVNNEDGSGTRSMHHAVLSNQTYDLHLRVQDRAGHVADKLVKLRFDDHKPTAKSFTAMAPPDFTPVRNDSGDYPKADDGIPVVDWNGPYLFEVTLQDEFSLRRANLSVKYPWDPENPVNYTMYEKKGSCSANGLHWTAPAYAAEGCRFQWNATKDTQLDDIVFWRYLAGAEIPQVNLTHPYEVTLWVEDAVGNVLKHSTTRKFYVRDSYGPVIQHIETDPPVVCQACPFTLKVNVAEAGEVRDVKANVTKDGNTYWTWDLTPPDNEDPTRSGWWTKLVDPSEFPGDRGIYIVRVTANDTLFNQEIEDTEEPGQINLTADGFPHHDIRDGFFVVRADAPPAVVLESPADATAVLNATGKIQFRVQSTFIDPAGITVKAGNSTANLETVSLAPEAYIVNGNLVGYRFNLSPTFTESGDFIVNVTAVDNSSQTRWTPGEGWTFTVDVDAPTVSHAVEGSTRTVDGTLWVGEGARLRFTLEDAADDAPVLYARVGSGAFQTVNGDTFNVPSSASGEVTVEYYAEDAAGNEGDVQTVSLTVDRTGPRVSLVSASLDEVEVEAEDAGVGLDAANLTLHYQVDGTGAFFTRAFQATGNGTYAVAVPGAPSGLAFYVTARDLLGNDGGYRSEANPYVVGEINDDDGDDDGEVENNPPSVTIQSPADGAEVASAGTVEWSASDEDGDALTVAITARDAAGVTYSIGTALPAVGDHEWDLSDLEPGTYTLTVRATDAKGAAGQASVEVTVVGETPPPPPVVNPVEAPPSEVDASSNVSFAVNVDAPEGKTIDKVEARLKRDGVLLSDTVALTLREDGAYAGSYTPQSAGDYEVDVVVTYDDGTTGDAVGVASFTAKDVGEIIEKGFRWTVQFGAFVAAAVLTIALAAYGAFGRRGAP